MRFPACPLLCDGVLFELATCFFFECQWFRFITSFSPQFTELISCLLQRVFKFLIHGPSSHNARRCIAILAEPAHAVGKAAAVALQGEELQAALHVERFLVCSLLVQTMQADMANPPTAEVIAGEPDYAEMASNGPAGRMECVGQLARLHWRNTYWSKVSASDCWACRKKRRDSPGS